MTSASISVYIKLLRQIIIIFRMLKVVWNIFKKVFGIFCVILSPLKRLWCRSRKRRDSDTILPLTNHYPSVENLNSNHNGTRQVNTFDDQHTQDRYMYTYDVA